MTEQGQQQMQQQATQSAQDFYGQSMGDIKGKIQSDRAQLERAQARPRDFIERE